MAEAESTSNINLDLILLVSSASPLVDPDHCGGDRVTDARRLVISAEALYLGGDAHRGATGSSGALRDPHQYDGYWRMLEATTQEVLSRTGLLDIITEFDLYPKDRAHLSPEELEAKMRKKISIEPIITRPDQKTIDAFKISFAAENPRMAQAVTNRLTSLFIEYTLERESIRRL